jgi:hypothetical protein
MADTFAFTNYRSPPIVPLGSLGTRRPTTDEASESDDEEEEEPAPPPRKLPEPANVGGPLGRIPSSAEILARIEAIHRDKQLPAARTSLRTDLLRKNRHSFRRGGFSSRPV